MGLNISKTKTFVGFVILMLITVSISVFVFAATPEGPTTLDVTESSRRIAAPTDSEVAYAGNISHMVIEGTTVTQTWQGYVGNITGTITLDDSLNYTLYDWTLANPEGEVYATYLSSVDWTTGNVFCWNWSDQSGDATTLSLDEYEDNDGGGTLPGGTTTSHILGAADNDVDGMNETFTCDRCDLSSISNTHTSFYVGGQFINGTGTDYGYAQQGNGPCPYTTLYNGSGTKALADFEEVILWSNEAANYGLIYTTLIQTDQIGYNNVSYDFEMIVGENGHDGNIGTTTYYFYVELE